MMLTTPPHNFQERIRSAIAEALGLSYADVIAQIIQLRTTLDNNTTTNKDRFIIPGEYVFLGYEMRGHIAMNSISTEAVAAGPKAQAISGFRDRLIQKAMNCRIQLTNPDTAGAKMEVIETGAFNTSTQTTLDLALSSLLPICGGAPVKWLEGNDVLPLIVPPNDRLEMTATLSDATASQLYGATEYGVALIGAYVRAKAL